MRLSRLFRLAFPLLVALCAPVGAQTVVPSVNALRMEYLGTNVSVTLSNYYLSQTGGGGMLYSDTTTDCAFIGSGTVSSGTPTVITVSSGSINWAKVALTMQVTSSALGITNDPVVAFTAQVGSTPGTITLAVAATSPGSNLAFTLNGDNGGTTFVDMGGDCFHRVSQTYSPQEWGAYEDGTHDDTVPLQNWMNALQPHIAVPGNSRITAPLVCGYGGLTTQGVIQGPATQGVAEDPTDLPPFLITADPAYSSGFAGMAMLTMANGVQCGIHGVGLIADSPPTGSTYDTVDAMGSGDVIDGHSYLSGGYYNVKGGDPGPGGQVNLEIYDSSLNNSVSDNALINSSNVKLVRNSFAGAGSGAIGGNNITFTGSDVVIADNIIQQARGWGIAAQGARQMRILGNYFDNNGKGDLGTGAIDIGNSGLVTITGNTFHRTGGASEGVATTSHVFFEGADDSISLANNVYLPGVTGSAEIAVRPDYDYDADPAAILTNIAIADNPAPQAIGVFSPNAQTLIASAASPHAARNYLTGLILSNDSGSGTKVDIAPGEAADSTGATILRAPSGCTVDLTHGGAGGLDTGVGTVAPNTTYFFYLIAGSGGGHPSCMASAGQTPTFLNTAGGAYTLSQSGNTTQGSPVIFNVGGPFPNGPAPNLTFNPVAPMSADDPISGSGIPSGTSIATTAPYLTTLNGNWSSSEPTWITNLPSVFNIATGMVAGNPSSSSTMVPQGTTILNICSAARCVDSTEPGCTTSGATFCVVLSQSISAGSTASIDVGGNYTITMTNSASSTGINVSLTVYHGLYRMIGALYTDSSGNVVNFSQNGDTFYLVSPKADIDMAPIGTSALPYTLASVPAGIAVEAFGRCVASVKTHIFNPSLVPGVPSAFPAAPGFDTDTLPPQTAFPYRAYTNSAQKISAQANAAGTFSCMTDGWVWPRAQ